MWFSAKYRGLALGVGHFCSNCSKWQPAPAPEARASYVKLCAPLARFGMILVAAVSGECGHGSVFYSWVSYIVMCVRVDGRGWPNEDD